MILNFIAKAVIAVSVMAAIACPLESYADMVNARCDIYPAGEDKASAVIPCTFSQRQGYIMIDRSDGVLHDLSPIGDAPGNFLDQNKALAYRQSGLGENGLIFRFSDESVFVYWDASSLSVLNPQDQAATSPTAPYTTAEYDATTLLPCSLGEDSLDQDCPAGISRGNPGSASLSLMKPNGEERILNFDSGEITTPDGGDLNWDIKDGDWYIRIDNQEFYIVPDAAVNGG
jgi:hypothetical protein